MLMPKEECLEMIQGQIEDMDYRIKKSGNRLSPSSRKSQTKALNFWKSIQKHLSDTKA